MKDPAQDIRAAVEEIWSAAPGPDYLFAIRVVLGNKTNDDDLRTVYAPMIFADVESAYKLAALVTKDGPGIAIMTQWVANGWLEQLSGEGQIWVPLAVNVVRLSATPMVE